MPTLPAAELRALTREQPIITEQLLARVHQGLLLMDVPRPERPSVQVATAQLPVRPQSSGRSR